MMDSLFDAAPITARPCIDISNLGKLVSVVATDTEGSFKFEHGDLKTTPEQFFDIVRYRRAVPL